MTWCGIGSGGGTAFCLDDDPTDNCTPYQQYCSQGLEARGQGQGLEVEDSRLEARGQGQGQGLEVEDSRLEDKDKDKDKDKDSRLRTRGSRTRTRALDLKIRSYPFPYLTISDTCDFLFYCVCFSFV